MAKSKDQVTTNGRSVFYAVLWQSFRQAAIDRGWALALHGSMASDMDIMAMPWTEQAEPVENVIKAISDCIEGTIWKDHHVMPHFGKPHGRIVYTLSIMGDLYLDISVMPSPNLTPIQ
jgi:hypothetical protein